jgi:hypothetical protein
MLTGKWRLASTCNARTNKWKKPRHSSDMCSFSSGETPPFAVALEAPWCERATSVMWRSVVCCQERFLSFFPLFSHRSSHWSIRNSELPSFFIVISDLIHSYLIANFSESFDRVHFLYIISTFNFKF